MNVVDELVKKGEGWAAAEQGVVRSLGIWAMFALTLTTSARRNALAPWTQESLPGVAANDSDYLEELALAEADFERTRLRNQLGGMVVGRHNVVETTEARA